MKKGVNAKFFKEGVEILYNERTQLFVTELEAYWKTVSEHGRSRAKAVCGFCDSTTEVYIHSFFGGGKRCDCCGALMTIGNCWVELETLTKRQIMEFVGVVFPLEEERVKGLKLKREGLIKEVKRLGKTQSKKL